MVPPLPPPPMLHAAPAGAGPTGAAPVGAAPARAAAAEPAAATSVAAAAAAAAAAPAYPPAHSAAPAPAAHGPIAALAAAGSAPLSPTAPAMISRAARPLSELNVVLHQGYTQSDHELQVLAEQGRDYLAKTFDQPGALFWIKLNHNDGEYMLGLGRRTSQPSDNPRPDTKDNVW
eukprot:scaffold36278_cov134-Isochrysis_galbana.AAC.1